MSYQKLIIIGHLGADPEMRSFPNGGSICNLRVATSETWKDKTTGERREHTEWHRVVLRDKLADIANQYLNKGSLVLFEGRLRTRKWKDQQGNERFTTELVGDEMKMLGSRQDGQQKHDHSQQNNARPAAHGAQSTQNNQADQSSGGGYIDDDIPFKFIDGRIY